MESVTYGTNEYNRLQGKETDVRENDDEDKYDLKKIISFPGFNVEPPHGTRDVSEGFSFHVFLNIRNFGSNFRTAALIEPHRCNNIIANHS